MATAVAELVVAVPTGVVLVDVAVAVMVGVTELVAVVPGAVGVLVDVPVTVPVTVPVAVTVGVVVFVMDAAGVEVSVGIDITVVGVSPTSDGFNLPFVVGGVLVVVAVLVGEGDGLSVLAGDALAFPEGVAVTVGVVVAVSVGGVGVPAALLIAVGDVL